MMKRTLALALPAALLAAPTFAADPPQPLRVFFTVAKAPPPPPDPKTHAKNLERERDAAWATYEADFKELKKKYGKDYEKWTREQKDEARLMYEKYVAKAIEYLFFTIKPKDLEDSVRDIKNSVVGKGLAGVKENILVAESAADAHLVLEALGRYGASKLVVGPKHFVFRFTAGGQLKPEGLGGGAARLAAAHLVGRRAMQPVPRLPAAGAVDRVEGGRRPALARRDEHHLGLHQRSGEGARREHPGGREVGARRHGPA